MRKQGFFVHRTSHADALAHVARAVADDGLIEVSRYGPNNEHHASKEGHNAWFYHTVGSGIFLETRHLGQFVRDCPFAGCSPAPCVCVRYERQSVPRCELEAHHTGAPGFWSSALTFRLGNGERCVSDSPRQQTLHCSNRPVPIWDGHDDPLPGTCGQTVRPCTQCPTFEWTMPPLPL